MSLENEILKQLAENDGEAAGVYTFSHLGTEDEILDALRSLKKRGKIMYQTVIGTDLDNHGEDLDITDIRLVPGR